MATHSSVLAWRIPGMGEPGGLLSITGKWEKFRCIVPKDAYKKVLILEQQTENEINYIKKKERKCSVLDRW